MRKQLYILAFSSLLLGISPAWGKVGRVDQVLFEGRDKTLDFTVTASTDLDASKAEALPGPKGRVLIIRIGGVTAKRRWIKAKDKEIKRVLLHSSKERPPGAVLRIRFKDKVVNRDFMRRISVYIEDAGIRVSIPRPSIPADLDSKKAASKTVSDNANGALAAATPAVAQPPPDVTAAPMNVADNTAAPMTPEQEVPEVLPLPESDTPQTTTEIPPPVLEPDMAPPETEKAEDTAPDSSGLVFLPGVRTQDVLAGFTDMSLRLEASLRARPGIHRIAVMPYLALDEDADAFHIAEVSEAVMTNRLIKRAGIVQTDAQLLEKTLSPLQRDDMGRFDLNEARAAGVSVGADTLIIGTASTDGNGYTIDTRAIDVQSGNRLGMVSQEFEQAAFHDYVSRVRLERPYSETLWRSAAFPGWGQWYQGDAGRGAVYTTIFSAALVAGITSAIIGAVAESTYRQSDRPQDVRLRAEANRSYESANLFYMGSGMVWLTAFMDSVFTAKDQVILDPELYGANR